MRKGFLSIFLLILLFVQAYAQYNVVRIRFPSSSYSAQLRGVSGTATAGLTIQGSYDSNLGAHVFQITITGPYKLYFDAAGGSSYSLDSQWSDTYGTTLLGYPDAMNAADFVAKVDPDGDDSLNATFLTDSTISLRKFTTAAYNFISSGGSVTNNPDDVTLENKGGSTVGIKDNYLGTQLQFKDTTQLKAATSDSAGMVVNLKQLSSANTKGGGLFVSRPAAEYAVNTGTVFASGNASYEWVRLDFLTTNHIDPRWFGMKADGSNDDATAFTNAVAVARTFDKSLRLPGGTIKVSSTVSIPLGLNESIVIEGTGAGRGATGRTILYGDGCTPLKLYKTSSHGSQAHIRNITFFRDTTSTARADTGLVLDYVTNSVIENCSFQGWNIGLYIEQSGQCKLINPAISHNKIGFRQTVHSDGLHISGGFVVQNDSIGVSSNFTYGAVVVGTEMSHQPVAIELVALSEWNIYGGRYEAADSTTFLVNAGCILNVHGSSFLPGTKGLIAQLYGSDSYAHFFRPVLDADFADFTYNVYTAAATNGRVTADYVIKSNANSPIIKVFDDLTNSIFVPLPYETAFSGNPSVALAVSTNWSDAGKIRHIAKRNSASYGPSALVFYQENNDSTYFTNVLTDNNDIRYGTSDSTGTRVDRMRTRKYRKAVTLEASGVFTRDTLQVDKFVSNQDYEIQVTPMFNTDSLLMVKVISRNFSTGQVISSIYHKGLNGTAGTLFYTISYQANRWDYP